MRRAATMRRWVWGLGFGVWGLGFGVWGLGFAFWFLGLWFRAWSFARPTLSHRPQLTVDVHTGAVVHNVSTAAYDQDSFLLNTACEPPLILKLILCCNIRAQLHEGI